MLNTQSERERKRESEFRISWLLSEINRLVFVIIDYCDKNIISILLGLLKTDVNGVGQMKTFSYKS